MVVSVKESKRLLFQDKENGIDQFEVFGKVIHLPLLVESFQDLVCTHVVENDQLVCPSSFIRADGIEHPTTSQSGHKLLNEERQQGTADCSQVEVVNHEWAIEYKGRSISHQLSTTENYDVVRDQGDQCLLQRGSSSLANFELEVLWRIAKYCLIEITEYRPYSNTEWSVECWQTNLDALEEIGHREGVSED